MKLIPINKRSLHAKIDNQDFEIVSRFNWFLHTGGYAFANIRRPDGGKTTMKMHRFILGSEASGLQVDHKNHDKLDNRRSNLRACTKAENMRNRCGPSAKNRSSGFLGVTWNKQRKKWQAYVVMDRKYHLVGLFNDPMTAAKARDQRAKAMFGEFVTLNFS